jgi:hypothetical protein
MQKANKAGCKTCTFVSDIKAEPELKKIMKIKGGRMGRVGWAAAGLFGGALQRF